MRRHEQKLILEIIQTLEKAVDELRRLLSQRDFQATLELLADCQNSAIQIGDFIESTVGNGTKSVAYLEEFCDILYEIGATMETGNTESVKKLKRQLIKINGCLANELKPDKIEIAFLPYKAEMWDSMESVWRAAKEDEHCDVHVVPIPYHDRLPDGSLSPMLYDGYRYPEYVQTSHWQTYKLEERHPDAIVIHNPYDNENLVTTVHPEYYSKELKKHTDLLCYIPYFVSTETIQEHFCVLSGVRQADRVFVQSEEIRLIYLRALRAFEKKHNCVGSFGKLEKKILASGSPKFDKAILSKPEDFPLPDPWRERIEYPDGSRKKIVLYCTSLGSLLQGGDAYLKKLEYELKTLGAREDIALWWRPHPLQAATYKAMRPQLLRAYHEIIARYQQSGYGIYDDTSELYRALCYGSVYYGDWSSLVLLFGVMGKRIMLQETEFIEKSKHLCFGSVAFDLSGNAWGWDLLFKGLFSLDLQKNKAKLMGKDETPPGSAAFGQIPVYVRQGKVISFPTFSDSIVEYDILRQTRHATKLNPDFINQISGIKGYHITHWVEHNAVYYCFGRSAQAIVVYDSQTREVRYHTDLFNRFTLHAEDDTRADCPIYIGVPSEDGWVTLLLEGCDSLLRYCLTTQATELLASHPQIGLCTHADFDGERFWLVSAAKQGIYSWNPATGEFASYSAFPKGFSWAQVPGVALRPVDCGEYVLFLPCYENMALCLQKRTGRITEYEKMPMPYDPALSIYKYQMPRRIGEKVYVFAQFKKTVYTLDIYTDEVAAHSFMLEAEDVARLVDPSACCEKETFGIKWADFIMRENAYAHELFGNLGDEGDTARAAAQKSAFLSLTANPNGEAGKAILNEILAQMRPSG